MRQTRFAVLLVFLFFGGCGRTTQDASAPLMVDGTPFVPSNAQSGWTGQLVASAIQCQGSSGVVNDFCSCAIKAITPAFTPDQVTQAASDAAAGTSTTSTVQQLSTITQNCLVQVASGSALVATSVNRAYQFTDSGCSTGPQTFVTTSLFCILLQRDSRNHSCALSQRQAAFQQYCAGTFQTTP